MFVLDILNGRRTQYWPVMQNSMSKLIENLLRICFNLPWYQPQYSIENVSIIQVQICFKIGQLVKNRPKTSLRLNACFFIFHVGKQWLNPRWNRIYNCSDGWSSLCWVFGLYNMKGSEFISSLSHNCSEIFLNYLQPYYLSLSYCKTIFE